MYFNLIKASLCRISLLAFLCLLSACAATGVREATHNTQLPRHAELTDTPFFPAGTIPVRPGRVGNRIERG